MGPFTSTVRAKTIAELIPEGAGPVIFKASFTGINVIAVRLIPVTCPARRGAKPENDWKQLLVPDRTYPAIKSAKFEK